ncbi:unnamed protein product, partial [marine sediment metagenome]
TLMLSEGTEFVYGENAQENSLLTRGASQNHIWLHVASAPSTHGVLRTDAPAKSEILEAAAIVKQHSKSKDYARVGVEYIQVKYVKIVNDAGGAELKKRAKKVYV